MLENTEQKNQPQREQITPQSYIMDKLLQMRKTAQDRHNVHEYNTAVRSNVQGKFDEADQAIPRLEAIQKQMESGDYSGVYQEVSTDLQSAEQEYSALRQRAVAPQGEFSDDRAYQDTKARLNQAEAITIRQSDPKDQAFLHQELVVPIQTRLSKTGRAITEVRRDQAQAKVNSLTQLQQSTRARMVLPGNPPAPQGGR